MIRKTIPIPAPGSAAIIGILIFRQWKRSIDKLTDKNTARWIDRKSDNLKCFKDWG